MVIYFMNGRRERGGGHSERERDGGGGRLRGERGKERDTHRNRDRESGGRWHSKVDAQNN